MKPLEIPTPFKRNPDDPNSVYYIRQQVAGRVFLRSTNETCPIRAKIWAERWAEVARSGRHDQLRHEMSVRRSANVSTFDYILLQYRMAELGLADSTIAKNQRCFIKVLSCSGLTLERNVSELSRSLIQRYQRKAKDEGKSVATINMVVRSAKAIFSNRACYAYSSKINPEFLADFKRTPLLKEPERMPEIPTDQQIAECHRYLPNIPEAYRAFLLGAYAGLRSKEIYSARWSWIEKDVISIGGKGFVTKSGRWRTVRLAPRVLEALGPRGPEDGCIVGGDAPRFMVTRQLPIMLRQMGFTSRDAVHSLRRWFGSHVAANCGLWQAQHALGHSSPHITAKSYARQISMAAPLEMAATVTPAQAPAPIELPPVPAGAPAMLPAAPGAIGPQPWPQWASGYRAG